MTLGPRPTPITERFWTKVVIDGSNPEGCWLWTAGRDRQGYGQFRVTTQGPMQNAHRVAYLLVFGAIPSGMVLDHLCRNPACVNPRHLEVVTLAENNARGFGLTAVNARKTHCVHGHPFSPENTRREVRSTGNVRRYCLTCERQRQSVRQARLKQTTEVYA